MKDPSVIRNILDFCLSAVETDLIYADPDELEQEAVSEELQAMCPKFRKGFAMLAIDLVRLACFQAREGVSIENNAIRFVSARELFLHRSRADFHFSHYYQEQVKFGQLSNATVDPVLLAWSTNNAAKNEKGRLQIPPMARVKQSRTQGQHYTEQSSLTAEGLRFNEDGVLEEIPVEDCGNQGNDAERAHAEGIP